MTITRSWCLVIFRYADTRQCILYAACLGGNETSIWPGPRLYLDMVRHSRSLSKIGNSISSHHTIMRSCSPSILPSVQLSLFWPPKDFVACYLHIHHCARTFDSSHSFIPKVGRLFALMATTLITVTGPDISSSAVTTLFFVQKLNQHDYQMARFKASRPVRLCGGGVSVIGLGE